MLTIPDNTPTAVRTVTPSCWLAADGCRSRRGLRCVGAGVAYRSETVISAFLTWRISRFLVVNEIHAHEYGGAFGSLRTHHKNFSAPLYHYICDHKSS